MKNIAKCFNISSSLSLREPFLGVLLLSLAFFTSCGSDDVTPGPLEDDQWLHPVTATAADQELQLKFYQNYNIYLLFNDTLKKEQTSVNPDGTPFYNCETVDLSYYLSGGSSGNNYYTKSKYTFDYLTTDAEKQAAARFIETQILPHLGGGLKPFSVLLVNGINHIYAGSSTGYNLEEEHPDVVAGYRCTALNLSGADRMSDKQLNALRNSILLNIVNAKVNANDPVFDEFYAPCASYYSTYAMNEDAEKFMIKYPTPYDLGLLENGYYSWSNGHDGVISFAIYNIKAKDYDLQDYITAAFSFSQDEFTARYGQYPIVMKKYGIIRSVLKKLGIVF